MQHANMHTQLLTCNMHVHYIPPTFTSHSSKMKVHESAYMQGVIPSIMCFWRSQKLLRSQAHLETNVRDRWGNHSQAAKGPGVRYIRYQGCTHRFGGSQGPCAETNWEKLCGYQWYALPTIPGAGWGVYEEK